MPTLDAATEPHSAALPGAPQASPPDIFKYWLAFAATTVLIFLLTAWWAYSPGQDHIAAIPLKGDGSWYGNYEANFEIQDNDVLFHGIGNSIANAQQADIIFLGTSKVLFGLDRHVFDEFAAKHHLKMFDMAFAGVPSGEFSLRIAQKWGLRPKLWVIDLYSDATPDDLNTSFFVPSLRSAQFGTSDVPQVVKYGYLRALKNVVGRNLHWRMKMALGLMTNFRYRSASSGNWYLDDWPNYEGGNNPRIKLVVGSACQAPAEELTDARRYAATIGGAIVLTQIPSAFSCDERVRDLATTLAVPAFTVDATRFSTVDGGEHLDGPSARAYSRAFFAWLEQQPEFRSRFPE